MKLDGIFVLHVPAAHEALEGLTSQLLAYSERRSPALQGGGGTSHVHGTNEWSC